ncbi:hypothetical protein Tco_1023102 [Tanacetum coccineum]
MEKGFSSPKGRGRGNSVKGKQSSLADVQAKANDSVESDTTSFPNVAKHFDQNAQSVLRSSSNTLGADIGKFMGDGAHRVNAWRIQLLRTMSRILRVNGLVKSMMTTKCLFFFKFSSKDGTNSMIENDDAMIENDAWLIPTVPLILKK